MVFQLPQVAVYHVQYIVFSFQIFSSNFISILQYVSVRKDILIISGKQNYWDCYPSKAEKRKIIAHLFVIELVIMKNLDFFF